MDGGPIDRLTEKQRACLRLVQQHYTSKQIARELGIGVHAVDQRIKGAMKTLGVASRAEAARMLARYEHQRFADLGQEVLPAGSPRFTQLFRWSGLQLKRLGAVWTRP